MSFQKYSPMIGFTVCMLILNACVVKDSPAPGCRNTIGFPSMGGCSGKAAIIDLEVTSAPDCLTIAANNCNGGVLNIRNACTDPFILEEIIIDPFDTVSLDVKMVDGLIELSNTHGNFSGYFPEEDIRFELTGALGTDPLQFAFTKTKPLCE